MLDFWIDDFIKIYYQLVKWEKPKIGWFKCNTDGASRGNPGESSAAFCVRNWHGDLVYAGVRRLSNTTSMIVEAIYSYTKRHSVLHFTTKDPCFDGITLFGNDKHPRG
ncbi:hypothetical protein R3W88_019298 [Solanum pinnatisectum]|uniref:RNase H type-1 domain-containing protein n=1 Tax=Solanum pinnatisectum TaxID=50273 RepID=A0AAV9KJJ1_9SOLN|nr:hypothetical protein R3W88_019298 [Solanum pinnatisectum]